MSDFIIACASTADLPDTYLKAHDIPVIRYPFSITNSGKNNMESFEDDCNEASRQKAYENMRKGLIYSTSMINAVAYMDFFRALLKTGKDVLYLDMSKEMSSSYKAAQEAERQIHEEYKTQKFVRMDTRCISGGLGLLVSECVKRKEEGQSLDEVVDWAEKNKLKIMHRFTVNDLSYLKRGGRVSNASALIGSLLSIKPVLYVPDEGKLTVGQKVRGRKAALQALLEGVKRDMKEPDGQIVHINHADCLADAQWLKGELTAAFPTLRDVEISNLGIVIGAHCGPGLLTVFYFGDQRKP